MKIKKYWIAVQIEENGKYSAAAVPCGEHENAWTKLSQIPGIVTANIFATKKAAAQTVLAWRDGFRAAGVYMWDTMPDGSPAPF